MASPNVVQGTLNRIRGSVTFMDHPELNITAPFLGPEGINMTPEGNIVDNLPTMTGIVTSPAPYQMFTIEVELLKSQSFSNLFKRQLETLATIGNFIVRPDTTTLGNYFINNGSIMTAGPGRLNGTQVGFVVSLQGYYLVNSSLYTA